MSHILRHVVRPRLFMGLVRVIGVGVLSGLGWMLGTEIFKAAQKDTKTKDAEPDAEYRR